MVHPGCDRLSGTIEVDETYIGGQKPGKRGRGAAGKAMVVIMVELKEGKARRIRLRRVPDASGAKVYEEADPVEVCPILSHVVDPFKAPEVPVHILGSWLVALAISLVK